MKLSLNEGLCLASYRFLYCSAFYLMLSCCAHEVSAHLQHTSGVLEQIPNASAYGSNLYPPAAKACRCSEDVPTAFILKRVCAGSHRCWPVCTHKSSPPEDTVFDRGTQSTGMWFQLPGATRCPQGKLSNPPAKSACL